MADKVPDIAVVRRTYNGLEGHRVKAGTRFAIGREQGGLPVISKARYQVLLQGKLVRAFGEEDTAPNKGAVQPRPLARTVTTMEGPGSATSRKIRDAARKRTRQDDSPGTPKQLKGPVAERSAASTSTGSQTGEGTVSSLSLGDQVQKTSTSKGSRRRGTRGAAPSEAAIPAASVSSPSTTR